MSDDRTVTGAALLSGGEIGRVLSPGAQFDFAETSDRLKQPSDRPLWPRQRLERKAPGVCGAVRGGRAYPNALREAY
jgi:hypothetical protein